MFLNEFYHLLQKIIQIKKILPSSVGDDCRTLASLIEGGAPEGRRECGSYIVGATAESPVTIPPSRLAPCHLPLHKGGFFTFPYKGATQCRDRRSLLASLIEGGAPEGRRECGFYDRTLPQSKIKDFCQPPLGGGQVWVFPIRKNTRWGIPPGGNQINSMERVTLWLWPGASTKAAGFSSQRLLPFSGLGRLIHGSMHTNFGTPGLLQIRV